MNGKLMNDLFRKYLDNNLTNQEFQDFQRFVNASTNEELEPILQQAWKEETGIGTDTQKIFQLKQDIDKSNHRNFIRNSYQKTLRIAAMIAIPLLIISMYFFFGKTSEKAASDMIVSVADGEKVNIVLPDGTKANLNSQTILSYDVNLFNKKQRCIKLSGEGFFEVAKNEKKPFIIKTSDMDVKVLGTTFNLLARDENNLVEIYLLAGKVNLTSNSTMENVILHPNQKAVLDKKTGKINVFRTSSDESLAWRRGELIFHGTTIRQIFREIERSYGVKISAQCPDFIMNDLFTGTFSVENLDETMKILKMHYNFNYNIDGKVVSINGPYSNKYKNN